MSILGPDLLALAIYISKAPILQSSLKSSITYLAASVSLLAGYLFHFSSLLVEIGLR